MGEIKNKLKEIIKAEWVDIGFNEDIHEWYVCLDGYFTLKTLKEIVALLEAHPEGGE